MGNLRRPADVKRATGFGFTLVELLVVIGIIALLISILLPALSRAREQAMQTVCLSRQRSLAQAVLIYANEFQGLTPQCIQASTPTASWPYQLWSYASGGTTYNGPTFAPTAPPVKSYKPEIYWHSTVFNCPTQTQRQGIGQYDDLGYIYCMNAWLPKSKGTGTIQSWGTSAKLSRIRRPSEVFLFIEAANTWFGITGYQWIYFTDDSGLLGSMTLTLHHLGGTNTVFADGHAEFMRKEDWPRTSSGAFMYEPNSPRWTGK